MYASHDLGWRSKKSFISSNNPHPSPHLPPNSLRRNFDECSILKYGRGTTRDHSSCCSKPCSFHLSEIMDPELSFIMTNEKSPDYSSAKKCDKMRQLENAWGAATGRSNAKNAVKSCVSQQFGAQKSIKVSFLIRGPGNRVPSDNQAPGGGFERQHGLRSKVIDHLTEIFKHWKSWW